MRLNIINACSDLGVNIDGSNLGPEVLKKHIINNDKINDIIDVKYENVTKSNDKNDLAKNLGELNKFNEKLYKTVQLTKKEGIFPITVGGDHSIAISSALASIEHENSLGIIWIDTHPDFNTFETTTTGNIHGMPLATITGNNKTKLTKFHNGNFYKNENTVIIGARDIDPLEKENLEKANIKIFSTNDVKTKNIEKIIDEAVSVALLNTNGLHISFDIDVIDPVIAPGISVGFKNGISKKDVEEILSALLKYKDKIKSFDIVEFNPKNDIESKTELITKDILIRIIDEFSDKIK